MKNSSCSSNSRGAKASAAKHKTTQPKIEKVRAFLVPTALANLVKATAEGAATNFWESERSVA